MRRSSVENYKLLERNTIGGGSEGSLTYERVNSRNRVYQVTSDKFKFYDGKYVMCTGEEHSCFVISKFPKELYELLKPLRHENVLNLISYDVGENYVITEKVDDMWTLAKYAEKFREKLVYTGGEMTPRFKRFIRLMLKLVHFLHGRKIDGKDVPRERCNDGSLGRHSLAIGDISTNTILVWDDNDDLQFKLVGIAGPFYRADNKTIGEKYIKEDLLKIAGVIRDVTQNSTDMNTSTNKFCNYIDSQFNEKMLLNAMTHPTINFYGDFEKRMYLELVMEFGNKIYFKKSGIKWKTDDETRERQLKSEMVTKNPYDKDPWSLVRIVRNSIKHFKELGPPNIIGSQLASEPYAFLHHVENMNPNFMIEIYEICGALEIGAIESYK